MLAQPWQPPLLVTPSKDKQHFILVQFKASLSVLACKRQASIRQQEEARLDEEVSTVGYYLYFMARRRTFLGMDSGVRGHLSARRQGEG